jgi:hypothetical protein
LFRIAVKPDIARKRIELIHSHDPDSDLMLGDRGTVVDVSELPYEDMPFKVCVHLNSGSRLSILEGQDVYRMVSDDQVD